MNKLMHLLIQNKVVDSDKGSSQQGLSMAKWTRQTAEKARVEIAIALLSGSEETGSIPYL